MSIERALMEAAGAGGGEQLYVEDVFSTYLYTGNAASQTINNGIALGSSPETVAFSLPALMNGAAVVGNTGTVAVNSSGVFVTVGSNGSGYPMFATSTDGSTWTTPALMNGSTTAAYMTAVTVNSSGLFVAVGYGAGASPVFATSTDGSTWTTPALMNGSAAYALMQAVTVNSAGRFVAVGYNGNAYPMFATSTDGSTWTTPALMNGSTTAANIKAVTVNSAGLFVAVGGNSSNYPLFATSTDGSTWTTPALMNGSTTVAYMYAVTVNSAGLFVAVGYNGSAYPVFATSTDGSTWTTPALMNGSTTAAYMYAVTVNSSGLLVAVGNNSSSDPVFATSVDGSTWATPALMNGSTTDAYMRAVAVNSSGLFVAVGFNGSGYPLFATSTSVPAVIGEGGLVWIKSRSSADGHNIYDTERGRDSILRSENTSAANTGAPSDKDLVSFNSNGFSIGVNYWSRMNNSGATYTSWAFRKAPKFFDVVTYTGDGVAGRTIAHDLGSVPGMIIVKCTSTIGSWRTYHQARPGEYANLQTTGAFTSVSAQFVFGNDATTVSPTSSQFTVGSENGVNASGATYVAYLFAHDAGGFGESGEDSVVSCGSFTGNTTVNLGWEPQYVLIKNSSTTGDWRILDNMRGWANNGANGNDADLDANLTNAEVGGNSYGYPTATGFTTYGYGGVTAIYLAIRRGPMRTPTSGTSVFSAITATASTGTSRTAGFPIDFMVARKRTFVASTDAYDRLRGFTMSSNSGQLTISTNSTAAETNGNTYAYNFNNTGFLDGANGSGYSTVWECFKRAPGFFDVVCYTGDSSDGRAINHNLGVVPELMIVKKRDSTVADGSWSVWQKNLGLLNPTTNYGLYLNTTAAKFGASEFGETAPTSSYFIVKNSLFSNYSGSRYVAYLFASCPGVSKVGSYTGTGAAQTIDCGFTAGARFVLIKRTDSTGDWYTYDTARGMVSGTDPYLLMNSTAAEVNANYVFTTTTGFAIQSGAPAGINASGGSFIYLAVA